MSDDEAEGEPSRDGGPAQVIEGNPELPRIAKRGVFAASSKYLNERAAEACPIKRGFDPAISISVRYDYPESRDSDVPGCSKLPGNSPAQTRHPSSPEAAAW